MRCSRSSSFVPSALPIRGWSGRSEPLAPSPAPADVFYKSANITKTRSNGAYWADGGIISTADEMIIFLKALNKGRILRKETVGMMHDWHKLHFPLEYGYGTMRFKLPWLLSKLTGITPCGAIQAQQAHSSIIPKSMISTWQEP